MAENTRGQGGIDNRQNNAGEGGNMQNMGNESGSQKATGQQRDGSSEDMTAGNSDHQNASANRGGTTDMGDEALRSATGNTSRGNHGSGMTTKRNVTGSDYDGQVSEG
jgi:hypothetical protein